FALSFTFLFSSFERQKLSIVDPNFFRYSMSKLSKKRTTSPPISGRLVAFDNKIEHPKCIASTTGKPKPTVIDGKQKSEHFSNKEYFSSSVICPIRNTRFSTPNTLAIDLISS